MKHKLPILALAALLSAGLVALGGALHQHGADSASPAGTPSAASPAGNELLTRAATTVEHYSTLQGRVRQKVQLFGHQVTGTGTYRQAWVAGRCRYRFDLRMATEPVASHYLAVSDGRFLWLRRQSAEQTLLRRVDLKGTGASHNASHDAESPVALSALGGLPGLLRRFAQLYIFSIQDETRLGREQVPAVVLRGRWRPDMLRRIFLPKLQGRPTKDDLARLPEPVPHEVEIVLGRDDQLPFFPYRIRCFRTTDAGSTIIMTLEFFELARGDSISPHVFRYDPGNEEVEDATDDYRAAWP